jgi:hypothetical protein
MQRLNYLGWKSWSISQVAPSSDSPEVKVSYAGTVDLMVTRIFRLVVSPRRIFEISYSIKAYERLGKWKKNHWNTIWFFSIPWPRHSHVALKSSRYSGFMGLWCNMSINTLIVFSDIYCWNTSTMVVNTKINNRWSFTSFSCSSRFVLSISTTQFVATWSWKYTLATRPLENNLY